MECVALCQKCKLGVLLHPQTADSPEVAPERLHYPQSSSVASYQWDLLTRQILSGMEASRTSTATASARISAPFCGLLRLPSFALAPPSYGQPQSPSPYTPALSPTVPLRAIDSTLLRLGNGTIPSPIGSCEVFAKMDRSLRIFATRPSEAFTCEAPGASFTSSGSTFSRSLGQLLQAPGDDAPVAAPSRSRSEAKKEHPRGHLWKSRFERDGTWLERS